MPIDRPTEIVRFTTDAFYQWHFANAFTRGDELVVDYVRYRDFESFHEIGVARGEELQRDPLATVATTARRSISTRHALRSEQLADRAVRVPDRRAGRRTAASMRSRTPRSTSLARDRLDRSRRRDRRRTSCRRVGARHRAAVGRRPSPGAVSPARRRLRRGLRRGSGSPTDRSRRSGSTTTCRSRFTASTRRARADGSPLRVASRALTRATPRTPARASHGADR